MSTLKFYWKVSRPTQVFLGGLTAWIIALLSNGPTWLSVEKIASAIIMSLMVLSSSIWHYGARYDVYARKHWDPVYINNPAFLVILGACGFILSIILAILYLPSECVIIVLMTAVAIALYAKRLDQYWPFKNFIIAAVCITPLLLGWLSGHRLNPILPFIISAAFFIYLTREILKDVVDQEANQGKRFTMVMDLGIPTTLKIAGCCLFIAVLLIGLASGNLGGETSIQIIYFMGAGQLCLMAIKLLCGKDISKQFQQIDVAVGTLLLSLFLVRYSMY